MKLIGKVKEYNGKFGTIISNNETIDFDKKDLSFNNEVKTDDEVEFRLETRIPDIKLARNIKVINKKTN